MKKIICLGIGLIFSSSMMATTVSSYTCPNTYRMIKIGDGMDAVRLACGQPTSILTRDDKVNTPINTVQWVYNPPGTNPANAATTIPVMIITLQADQVLKIEKNGAVAGNSTCVNGMNAINVGDNASQALIACGPPSYINNMQTMDTATKKVTEWTYNYGPYKPQIIIDFENGAVSQISSGGMGS